MVSNLELNSSSETGGGRGNENYGRSNSLSDSIELKLRQKSDSQDTLNSITSTTKNGNGKTVATRIQNWFKNFSLPSLFHEGLLFIVLPLLLWLVAYLLAGSESLPEGQIFTLLVLEFGGRYLGYCVSFIKLPPMVGMLGVGLIIRNAPYLDVGKNLNPSLSSYVRQIALAVILTRAGLGLDLPTLRRLKGLVLRLAVIPTVLEATVVAIVSHFLLDLPWGWAFILGFVVAPVSPAVVVPRLLALREEGYGVEKGIPTFIIASASLDNIVAISLFGVSLGFALAEGSMVMTIFQGPLEVLMGLAGGLGWGTFIGLTFHSDHKKDRNAIVVRGLLTFGGAILFILGFRHFDYSAAGPLACLTLAITAAYLWRLRQVFDPETPDILCWVFYLLWFVFEPLLFGAIGCQIDLLTLDARVVQLGLVCIVIGSAVRFVLTFLMASKADLTVKEKLFTAISWSPKATVQAAIGPVALDTVRKLGREDGDETLGLQILTIAVLTILLTAPLGEIGVMWTGSKFLQRVRPVTDDQSGVSGQSIP